MPIPILIAYATRSGSTREVASAVGAALREAGLDVEVLPVDQVSSLDGKTAVLLGAPLYIGSLPKEFHKFLVSHRARLAPLRTWCFVLGPTRTEPGDFEVAGKQAQKELARHAWLHPVEIKVFGGKWDVKGLPFPFSLARYLPMNPMNKIPPSDIRDWPAIHEWGKGIARQLKSAA
ncbi:MAG: flavodoxin domain-containing protein [Terracidiphilus sp.]